MKVCILFDGTWNNSIDYGGSKKWLKSHEPPLSTIELGAVNIDETSTNIARMFHLLGRSSGQEVFYIRGVGTGDKADSFTGGAFGHGAEERVEEALGILENFNSQNDVYIFGFSRGAAIARQFSRKMPQEYSVNFMGLFDTVAAFGMPQTEFGLEGFSKRFQSYYNRLAIEDRVATAVHLVALDEDRKVFLPTLISKSPTNSVYRKEIWFRGNHGDIGGGWPDEDEPEKPFRRRQVTLSYMLEQHHGLDLIDGWQDHEDVLVNPANLGKIHGQEDYDFKSAWGGE